jgi:hypothetical protein
MRRLYCRFSSGGYSSYVPVGWLCRSCNAVVLDERPIREESKK